MGPTGGDPLLWEDLAYVHINGDVYPCWTPPKMEILNARDVGSEEVLKNFPEFGWSSCLVSSLVELNYIGSSDFAAISNTMLKMLTMRRKK